jgi:superoxide dismutase, Cu-Zn family
MSRIRTSIATAVAVIAVPSAAMAASVLVDHGRGPTYTHDPAYAGITTQVHAWTRNGSTAVRLMVDGLPPGGTFGAHVHTGTCGSDPTTSGGHYQHAGASGPLAEREVWLDVTADAQGRGVTTTTVPWSFTPGTAGSVVIHALPTNPTTGAAGARLACTSVAFGDHSGH